MVNSDTQITAYSPPQSAGPLDITVVTPTGTSAISASDRFTYSAINLPVVSSLSPSSGTTAGGTTVTVRGSHFTAATAVNFGGVPATFYQVANDSTIFAVAPPQAAGTVDLTVTTAAGTSAPGAADHFTYSQQPVPTVTGVSPNTGLTVGATRVTITGSGFTGTTAVSFGGVPVPWFQFNSDTSLTVFTPPEAAGIVDVTVTTNAGTSATSAADHFTYVTSSKPLLTGVSNRLLSDGSYLVTVSGSNFTGASSVSFGSTTLTNFTVSSDSQITLVAPPATSSTTDVTVTTPAGTSATSANDRYTFGGASAPTVTGLSTTTGTSAGGTPVTITGTGFSSASAVLFGDVPALLYTVQSDTSILAILPPQGPGTVDVTVTNPYGSSTVSSADHLTYSSAAVPAVTSLATTSGTAAGGTLLTINGSGFTGATKVTFTKVQIGPAPLDPGGGTAAAFTVNSDSSISLYTPAAYPATYDITVTTFAGTSSTGSADQFTFNGAPSPSVTAVSPNSGTTPGGNTVVITGSHFLGATAVQFSGVHALSFTVSSDSSITAVVPPKAAGTVDVVVTTTSATSTAGAADHYTYTNLTAPAPAVTAVSPNSGATGGGRVVTITGTNFTGASAVKFGSTSASFTISSDTSITATAPSHSAGTVDITVTTNNGTSSTSAADQFTYLSTGAPIFSSLSPNSGTSNGGTSVTINGSNFTGATAVYFGSVLAPSFTVNSATRITATTPAEPLGTVDVTVVTPSGVTTLSNADHFTFNAAALPTVTSLNTSSGSTAGGTSVTITGTGFTAAIAVSFGDVPAPSFTVNSSTSITAVAPPQAADVIDVRVSNYTGSSPRSTADRYTYTAATTPAVISLGTTSGSTAGGTSVIITGTNFTGASAVNFGGASATSYTVSSDTSITAVSPPEAAGTVDVTVTTPTGTSASGSADQFTYTAAAAPTVTGLGTTSGSTGGGTSVAITGTGFTGATAVNFGGFSATSYTVNSDTSITAVSPPQAAGTVDVTVTTFAGTSATGSADRYTYTAAAAPSVTSVAATSGSVNGGDLVAVLGSGFTGASAVSFGGNAALYLSVLSDGALVAAAPPGTAGTVDITVTTPTGTSAIVSADHYTYTSISAPTITSLGTTSGSTAGGTSVLITGTNLLNTTAVSFGGVAAPPFWVASPTQVQAFSPPDAAGTYDVTVTTAGGTSALGSADRYTYSAASAPAVTSLATSSGSTAGGTSVTITGTNFTGATGVYFGAVAAPSFTVNSATSITAASPSQAAGTVDVTVNTPTGTSATGSGDRFTYTAAAAPSVTALSLTSGGTAGGSVISITGSGFTGATAVNFGTGAAAFSVQSDAWITATVPPQAAGTIDVTVTTPSGTSATGSADQYTYTSSAAPAVTGLTPASGSTLGGDTVTVLGSGFTGASAVSFGAIAAPWFEVQSDGVLLAQSPGGTAGAVDVTVTTPNGTSSTGSADHFTYNAASAPTVTGISPATGTTQGNTAVIVTGSGFTGATAVSFGSFAAPTFMVNSDTQLTVLSPPQGIGTVDITVTTPVGTSATGSADQFSYTLGSAPGVTSVTPNSGSHNGGTVVTLAGSNLTGATQVLFGTVPAASFTLYTDGSIVAVSPAEAAGTVDITVTTYSGTSSTSAADQFTFSSMFAPVHLGGGSSGGGSGSGPTGRQPAAGSSPPAPGASVSGSGTLIVTSVADAAVGVGTPEGALPLSSPGSAEEGIVPGDQDMAADLPDAWEAADRLFTAFGDLYFLRVKKAPHSSW
jgi:hypothetical protein